MAWNKDQGKYAAAATAASLRQTELSEAERIATAAERERIEGVRATMEAERALTAAERHEMENVRIDTEAVLAATETERLATKGVREATESERQATATERQNTSTVRTQTEAERIATESVRKATDAVRVATETERLASVNERLTFKEQQTGFGNRVSAAETKATNAETTANLAKARADLIVGQAGTDNTELVDSRLGADLVARPNAGTLIREIHAQQLESARQTTTLSTGVAVVNGGVDALADVEIEGRTLISLPNSNLEAGKQYVIADKKTKVIVDGATVSGVGKFTKTATERPTIIRVENFEGKQSGSVVENPHVGKYSTQPSLQKPSTGIFGELSTTGSLGYDRSSRLDGSVTIVSTNVNGGIAQDLRSFNLIEAIERNIGRIPRSSVADKVLWLKDNVAKLTGNWHGFGSSVGGNKAYFTLLSGSSYYGALAGTNSGVARFSFPISVASSPTTIDSNGLVHYLAYADPAGHKLANPTTAPTLSLVSNAGSTIAEGTYFVKYTWVSADGETVGSAEASLAVTAGNDLSVTVPAFPAGVTKARVFIVTATGVLTLQGEITTSGTAYVRSTPIDTASAAIPTTNTSVVIASTINTDYIDLEIELKPTADFTRPKVPLYEVTADSYAKILVDWNADEVINRYPAVEGVQHLQGVGVVAEGENLFNVRGLALNSNTTLSSNGTGVVVTNAYANSVGVMDGVLKLLPNTQYTISAEATALSGTPSASFGMITVYNGSQFFHLHNGGLLGKFSRTFTTPSDIEKYTSMFIYGNAGVVLEVKDIMITPGNVAKPFVPRNPSYLYADVKLGAIGDKRDVLYEQDGQRLVRKVVEKDVVLGGDLGWLVNGNKTGFKTVYMNYPGTLADSQVIQKYNGKKLQNVLLTNDIDLGADRNRLTGSFLYISVSTDDTGFADAYTPSVAEWKAFFYGYRMNNGTYGTPYDSTGTRTWIPIGDTSNARAVTTVPTSASPTQLDGTTQPYKLSYVLATPQIVNVSDKVEGSLKVNGLTQVEVLSGIVRREKVVPKEHGTLKQFFVNEIGLYSAVENNPLKYRASKILKIYRNGIDDTRYWGLFDNVANIAAGQYARIESKDFDPTAEYTVTYIALDKPQLTANPTNVKLFYANNVRSALEDVVGDVQDNSAKLSVFEKAIVDLYVRVKALGG